jgi:hypothetical protein
VDALPRNRATKSKGTQTDGGRSNQRLSVSEALLRGRMLDDEGLYWIEEPVRHDD